MAVSPYFNHYPANDTKNNEYRLLENVISESISIMGTNCYYIPRESWDSGDMIFGEYAQSAFHKAILIDAYIANVEGFEGQSDFFSKFGLEIRETSNFVVSRHTFRRLVPSTLRQRPQEGDLVYIPVFHRLFEIKFIEEELMFFSQGNRNPYVYEMRCELFRYSEEEIATGVPDVDQVASDNAYVIQLRLNTNGSGNYSVGDLVYQSPDGTYANNTAHATMKQWFKANGTMFVYNVTGGFGNGTLYANSSNARYNVTTTDTRSDFNGYNIFDNEELKTDQDLILDLSEINPFGTP